MAGSTGLASLLPRFAERDGDGIQGIVTRADLQFSGITQARKRLGAQVMREVFDGVAQPVATGTAGFPPEDRHTALPKIHAEITCKAQPRRRHRTCPRSVKRTRHNSYRVKKRDEPASTRHTGPATIRLHTLNPHAA